MSRVLVIEDEDLQRTAFVRALSKLEECCVIGVGSLGAALESIDAQRPDVIVSDIGLPDRLGVELVKELSSRAIDAPVLFVTADVQTYRHLVPAGVPLMEKPVPLVVLRETIRRMLARLDLEVARLAG
jgi:DNA-binding NtrC family response regulator